MADKIKLSGAGSFQPLGMDDKSSLDREVSSFCRNLEAIKGRMIDEWVFSQHEESVDSMKESKEAFFFYVGSYEITEFMIYCFVFVYVCIIA